MKKYKVEVCISAKKELKKLPKQVNNRIIPALRGLETEPRPKGCIKINENPPRWRVRVGDYRIVYAVDDESETIDIRRIRHRKDVYKKR